MNGALVVLFHENIESIKDVFSFPVGRRFHYVDPAGNKLRVWSDK